MTYSLHFDRDTPTGRERLTNPNVASFTTIEQIMIWVAGQGNREGTIKVTISEKQTLKQ